MAVFREADAICKRDGARLWGRPVCGPMLVVDPADNAVIANQADDGAILKASGQVYVGLLPPSVIIANTPVEWSGMRWTELTWPLLPKGESGGANDEARVQVMIAHELFHRIQPSLGLVRPEAANQHLDTLQGRYLMQLEWRALAEALTAPTAARRIAIGDALLFQNERYRLFPKAAAEENDLMVNEGVPEYTGVKLGLATPRAQTDYAVYDLSAFVNAPTFVRSFAYALGPAYGLLLDQADPAWREKLNAGLRLDQLLSTALNLSEPAFGDLKAREAIYDNGALSARETRREEERQRRLAALKVRLVDGPVLMLPTNQATYQFNPQTLIPLGEFGAVYPTMRLSAAWGALEVESGGALLNDNTKLASVSAVGIAPSKLSGDGWRLTLNKGWAVAPGSRKGDLAVKPIVVAAAP